MPAVTGRDEPWPFFHFWRHHFWPKLASFMLNFCRRRRSFQRCPDRSDRPNGAWDMHKNAQKVEQKTQTKICCHHTWLLHGKSCPSGWRFLKSFLTASKPSRRSIQTSKSLKTYVAFSSHHKIWISAHARVEMSQNAMLVAGKPSCRDASACLTRLKLIWPRSSLKTSKMSKKRLFRKKLRQSIG